MKKKILILGGSSEIGMNLVKLYIKKKWFVALHYSSNKPKIKKKIKNLKIIKSNFLIEKEKTILSKFKNDYDVIINLTGYVDNVDFENNSLKKIINAIKVNSLIPLLIFKKNIPYMKKKKWGRIVNTSSIGIKFGGGINNLNYSMSKHLNEFIPQEIKKLSSIGIYFNCLRIGVTDTLIHKKIKNKNLENRVKLIPLNRPAKSSEISHYLFYLGSEQNKYISNQIISVSGGE